jgi:hypothetical protein
MFLLEIRPDRAEFPEAPKPVQEKRRSMPGRLVAIGHEIDVGDPLSFQPDLDVPARYVKAVGQCQYDVDLGSLKVRVRTAE